MKDLYSQNSKILMKETKEDINKWNDILRLLIERVDILKMFILPKDIERFNKTSIKVPMPFFFQKNRKKNPLNLDETTKDWLAKAILGKRKAGGIILPNFKVYIKLIQLDQRRQWQPTPVLLPGKIPWTEEPGRLQSMGSIWVGHDWVTSLSLFTFLHWRRKWQYAPVFLPGEAQGWESLVSFRLWGRTESDTTEAT